MSTPRLRSPSAIAPSMFSSRWNRMVLAIALDPRELFLERPRTCLRFQFFNPSLVLGHLLANLIGMREEICQGRMNLRMIQLRKRGDDLIYRAALEFVPNVDVLNADARACNSR